MERVRLKVPDLDPIFTTNLKVQVSDLNYGNHVGNDRILLLAHEVRQQFLASIEQSELSFFNASLIMSDSTCVYKSQAFWGDEIEGRLYMTDLTETAMRLFYQLRNPSTNKDIALVSTTMVFFNYDTNKVTKLDQEMVPKKWLGWPQ